MDTRIARFIAALATLAVGGVIVAGCGGGQQAVADKAGSETVSLRMAAIDGPDIPRAPGVEAFLNHLVAVSQGALQVEVTHAYGDGAADAESRLVEAIASGDLDGGWPSTRAFNRAGITGLDAVEAPMMITNYAAQKELVSGHVGETVIERLDGSGIVGLALSVGDLRRPFAAESPLLELDDWNGATFRTYNSAQQGEAVRALGGTPVDLSFSWGEEMQAGRLRGVEIGISENAPAGNFTSNVVLWPKVFVIAISEKRYEALSDQQRAWVDAAADQASQASTEATYDETSVARDLCDKGVRFVAASEAQIAELRTALEPVVEKLANDPESRALLADIQAIAAAHPETEVPKVPASCTGAAPDIDSATTIPDDVSTLPDGIYRVEIRLADVEAAGISNGPGHTGTWTLAIEDGTYVFTCRSIADPGHDCGNTTYEGALEAGYLRGTDDTASFDFDEELMSHLTGCKLPATSEPGHCYTASTYSATWKLTGDQLTFGELDGRGAEFLTLGAWQKID